MIRRLLPIPLVLALSACAGAKSEYACPGLPSQPLCLSTWEVYRLSDGDGPPPAAERRPSLMATPMGPAPGAGAH
jgi:hypothetical protein